MKKTGESYTAALAQVRTPRTAPPLRSWPGRSTPAGRELEQLAVELCHALGCGVIPDPHVAREWATPAFLIRPAAGELFYLDLAVAVGDAADADRWPPAVKALADWLQHPQMKRLRPPHPTLAVARAVSRVAGHLCDPDLPYVVAVTVPTLADVDAGVTELWTGCLGPHLQVSAVLAIELQGAGAPAGRLYHHPEPRRPLFASPLLRLPQAIWARGRYVHGAGELLASLVAPRM
jgi:hypothetical protein